MVNQASRHVPVHAAHKLAVLKCEISGETAPLVLRRMSHACSAPCRLLTAMAAFLPRPQRLWRHEG